MKQIIQVCSLCLLGFASIAWSLNQFERMELVYERERDDIESTFRSERLSLPQRYVTILRDLEWEATLANDQEGARAIRDVRTQFVLDPTADSLQAAQDIEGLDTLRQEYQVAFRQLLTTKEEDLAVLQNQYRAALARLRDQLHREGQDDVAQRVEDSLASLPTVQTPASDEDDLIIDLGDDDAPTDVASRDREPAPRRPPGERTPPAPRERPADGPDPFDALMDAWLE